MFFPDSIVPSKSRDVLVASPPLSPPVDATDQVKKYKILSCVTSFPDFSAILAGGRASFRELYTNRSGMGANSGAADETEASSRVREGSRSREWAEQVE